MWFALWNKKVCFSYLVYGFLPIIKVHRSTIFLFFHIRLYMKVEFTNWSCSVIKIIQRSPQVSDFIHASTWLVLTMKLEWYGYIKELLLCVMSQFYSTSSFWVVGNGICTLLCSLDSCCLLDRSTSDSYNNIHCNLLYPLFGMINFVR